MAGRDIATRQARCGKIDMANKGGQIRAAARDLLGVVMATESTERQETSALLDTVAWLSDLADARLGPRASIGAVVEALDQETLLTMRDAPTRSHRAQGRRSALSAKRFLARRNPRSWGKEFPTPLGLIRPWPSGAARGSTPPRAARFVQPSDPQRRQQHRARGRFPVETFSPSLAIALGRRSARCESAFGYGRKQRLVRRSPRDDGVSFLWTVLRADRVNIRFASMISGKSVLFGGEKERRTMSKLSTITDPEFQANPTPGKILLEDFLEPWRSAKPRSRASCAFRRAASTRSSSARRDHGRHRPSLDPLLRPDVRFLPRPPGRLRPDGASPRTRGRSGIDRATRRVRKGPFTDIVPTVMTLMRLFTRRCVRVAALAAFA